MDSLLWPIVASAVDLLTSGDIADVKKCDECDWLFLDSSKNRSRRFCKTVCGDRARARRYYARHRADLQATP
jgi:predicted RNA-binding Zn ribbon-like protein